jgi:hypothetical protein
VRYGLSGVKEQCDAAARIISETELEALAYDFKPNPRGLGTIVEYRSRLKINNGRDKVKACL